MNRNLGFWKKVDKILKYFEENLVKNFYKITPRKYEKLYLKEFRKASEESLVQLSKQFYKILKILTYL